MNLLFNQTRFRLFLLAFGLSVCITKSLPGAAEDGHDSADLAAGTSSLRSEASPSPSPAPTAPFIGPGPTQRPQILLRGRYLSKSHSAALLEVAGTLVMVREGDTRNVSFPDWSSVTFEVTEISRERVHLEFKGFRPVDLY